MNHGQRILRRLAPMIPVPIGVRLMGFSPLVFAGPVTAINLLTGLRVRL